MTTSLLLAGANLLSLVALSVLTLFAMLILRHPLLPKWLQNEAVAQSVSLVLTAGFFIAVIDAMAELGEASIPYGIVALIVGGVPAGSAYILWKLFNIGGRLARADAGLSPFAHRQPAPVMAAAALDPAATGV